MKRTIRVASAAFLLAPVAWVATASGPVGAAPAPILSVTSGTPGTILEVSSPDCTTDPGDDDIFVSLQARLLVGVSPTQVLAGAGSGSDGTATIVIPDWVDASQPAVIATTCTTFDTTSEDDRSSVSLDPAEFDILPGAGAPKQTRTFSRTSVRVGQGLVVGAAGCTLPGADFAGVSLVRGNDSSDPALVEVAFGGAPVDGASFEVEVIASNADVGFQVSSSVDVPGGQWQIDELVANEYPNDVISGTYLAIAYCSDPEGATLFYEPQVVEVTGTSPTGDLDLTVTEATRTAALAGAGCSTGVVDLYVLAIDGRDLLEEKDLADLRADGSARRRPFAGATRTSAGERIVPRSASARGRTTRALADDGYLEATVTPEGGAWRLADDLGFDQGIVFGYARCGDPFADGFEYDPQVAVIDRRTAAEPTPTTTAPTTAAPTPVPARAVPGRPTYAG